MGDKDWGDTIPIDRQTRGDEHIGGKDHMRPDRGSLRSKNPSFDRTMTLRSNLV